MKIDSYSFGKIALGGATYTSDVIIYPGRVHAPWWRKEGHLLQLEDLGGPLQAKPEVLVIGTGYYGVMRVPRQLIELIGARGIEVEVERTTRAVELYNSLAGGTLVIAALHITC